MVSATTTVAVDDAFRLLLLLPFFQPRCHSCYARIHPYYIQIHWQFSYCEITVICRVYVRAMWVCVFGYRTCMPFTKLCFLCYILFYYNEHCIYLFIYLYFFLSVNLAHRILGTFHQSIQNIYFSYMYTSTCRARTLLSAKV